MSIAPGKKICAILLAMGGPNEIGDISRYLYNIFSDRTLIKLPGGPLFQKPLARLISIIRTPKVKARYKLIGGGSPLLRWTEKQAGQVEKKLSQSIPNFRCCVAMRYFEPYIETTLAGVFENRYDHIIFLPMYPQYSIATTGSCFAKVARIKDESNTACSFIKDYYSNERYIALMQEYIAAHKKDDEVLLFSAHSLPQELVDDGDPYVEQVNTTAKLAADGQKYYASFQSRTGPVNWVGPDTVATARRLLKEGKSIFVVPVSFVCDHIETLYEIDIDLPKKLGDKAKDRVRRMPMFNDDPGFSDVLVNLIEEAIKKNDTT